MTSTETILAKFLRSRARPDTKWVSRLLAVAESKILYLLNEVVNEQLANEKAIDKSIKSTGRNYYAQFPAPLELYIMARILKPRTIVESGVSSGLCSAHFLMALEKNERGRLHSIDLPQYQKHEARSRGELSWSIPKGRDSGWAIPAKLKKRWSLHKGKSEDTLPELVRQLGTIDIFCHDSPWTPEHLAFEFKTIQPGLHQGSVIVADNTGMNPRATRQLARKFDTRVWHRRTSDLIGIRIS